MSNHLKVRIGFAPGPFPSESEGHDLLRHLVDVGEEHGYDSIWLSDRVVGGRFPLEPVVALSMIAAYSDTLKFGTSVIALPLRNPVLLAKENAILNYLLILCHDHQSKDAHMYHLHILTYVCIYIHIYKLLVHSPCHCC